MIEEPTPASLSVDPSSLLENPAIQFINGVNWVRGIVKFHPGDKSVTVNRNLYHHKVIDEESATETLVLPELFAFDTDIGERVWSW